MKWRDMLGRGGGDPPDFTGKVVAIYCDSTHGGVFEEVRVVSIGFSHFVVGRKLELESWREGVAPRSTAWFGINAINQMYVYENLDEARQSLYPEGLS